MPTFISEVATLSQVYLQISLLLLCLELAVFDMYTDNHQRMKFV